MKLEVADLERQLARTIVPVYLVSGDEPLLVQESCDLLRGVLRSRGFEREVYEVGAKFEWERVLFSAASLSLFASRKLIELRLESPRPGVDGGKVLRQYCERPADDTVLLLIAGKLDRESTGSAWFKAIDGAGVVLRLWPVNLQELPNWLVGRGRKHGLHLDAGAARLLAERVEGNLLAADQELQRLALLTDQRVITEALVAEGVLDSSRYSAFGLVDAALEAQPGRIRTLLRGLRGEGTPILVVLSLLARELRSLIDLRADIERGQGVRQAIARRWVLDSRKPLLESALRRLRLRSLEDQLAQLATIDQLIKGQGQGEPWDELEVALFRLAGLEPGWAVARP